MELTEKLITWFKSLSETEKQRRFPDCTPNEKMLRILPEYAKKNILLYNGVK